MKVQMARFAGYAPAMSRSRKFHPTRSGTTHSVLPKRRQPLARRPVHESSTALSGLQSRIQCYSGHVQQFARISTNPEVMGGKPCIREMRVTVGTVVGLIAEGHSTEEILKEYPYLEKDDIQQCLQYASMRVNEIDVPLTAA